MVGSVALCPWPCPRLHPWTTLAWFFKGGRETAAWTGSYFTFFHKLYFTFHQTSLSYTNYISVSADHSSSSIHKSDFIISKQNFYLAIMHPLICLGGGISKCVWEKKQGRGGGSPVDIAGDGWTRRSRYSARSMAEPRCECQIQR